MKKIFLIFTLIVSSYVYSSVRPYISYEPKPSYEVCSSTLLSETIRCVNEYISDGFKAQSGLHAVQTPKGTLFFQAVIYK